MYWLYYGAVACTYERVLLRMCLGYCKKKVTFKLFYIHLRHIHLECHTLYYIFITVAAISFKELSSVYVHAFECQTRYAPGLLQEKSSHKVCVCGTPRCQTRGVLGYCNLL